MFYIHWRLRRHIISFQCIIEKKTNINYVNCCFVYQMWILFRFEIFYTCYTWQMHAFKCVWICVILNKNHTTKTKYNQSIYHKFSIAMCFVYELTMSYKASLKIFAILLFLSFWWFLGTPVSTIVDFVTTEKAITPPPL